MANITAVFGILFTLGVAFPGLLTAWWLLFPATVERARLRLDRTPWRCFWLGGVLTAILSVPIGVLLALPFGPAKFTGWVLVAIALAFSALGAAGLASKMGDRLAARANAASPPQARSCAGPSPSNWRQSSRSSAGSSSSRLRSSPLLAQPPLPCSTGCRAPSRSRREIAKQPPSAAGWRGCRVEGKRLI